MILKFDSLTVKDGYVAYNNGDSYVNFQFIKEENVLQIAKYDNEGTVIIKLNKNDLNTLFVTKDNFGGLLDDWE